MKTQAPAKLPNISIGLPVYNGENYLAAAIDSLLGQTYGDFELILSDNGSTDRTPHICQAFAARDNRVRCYRSEQNRGAVWNYNRVLELSRGRYFKWASHDDIHDPPYLERCLEVLESDETVAWCHSKVVMIDEHGELLKGNIAAFGAGGSEAYEHSLNDATASRYNRSSAKPHQRFDGIILSSAWGVDCYGLTRTALLRKTRGFLPVYGSEKTLLAELGLLGRYAEVPEPLFRVRVHPQASGQHMTVAAQQQHVGPRRGSRWIHPRLQMLLDYTTAVFRAPISLPQKFCCFWTINKYIFQIRKWRGVLRSLLRGTGTGGGNELFIDGRTSHD